MAYFPHQRNRLQPSEALLDAFPLLLTDRISAVSCGSSIDRAATAPLDVLRHVRSHLHVPAFRHKVSGVVSLVAAYRDSIRPRNLLDHPQRRISFRRAGGL